MSRRTHSAGDGRKEPKIRPTAGAIGVQLTAVAARVHARVAASDKWLWVAVFVPTLMIYLATLRVNGGDMITDVVSVTGSAWQLAHHGTPRIPVGTPVWDAWLIPSGSGHVISNREPGLIGLAALFYVIFHSASIMDVAPASLAAALVTAAAVATLTVLVRQFVSARAALITALVVGLGTTTWAVSGTSLFPHGPDELYLALAILALSRGRYELSGLALALAVLTRPTLAVVALVFGVWHSWVQRSVRPALSIGLTSAAGLAGLLVYSHEFWGGGLQSQYTATDEGGNYTGRFSSVGPQAWGDFFGNIVGTLISPGRGILIGSPFLIVLALGLRRAWQVAPMWVRSSAVAGLVYIVIQLKASRFQGGDPFWSYRYPIEMLTLLAPLLVLAWREYVSRTSRRRAWFAALVAISITMQAVGAVCFPDAAPNGTVVWTLSDLHDALIAHPVLGGLILAVGYAVAAVLFRRIDTDDSGRKVDMAPGPTRTASPQSLS
jgi:hypothetical protein